jgi:hypothetical protein
MVVAVLAAGATPASADWILTPYLGLNFGGSANFGEAGDLKDDFAKKGVFGVSVATGGVIGFEFDAALSPSFFEITDGDDTFSPGDNKLTTVMFNLTIGAPLGGQSGSGVRPYAAGGVGIMRSEIQTPLGLFEDLNSTDLAINVGGGVMAFFTDKIGIRGDVRYFRSLQDNEPDGNFDLGLSSFHFLRGTVGASFRF